MTFDYHSEAKRLDAQDPLAGFREHFHLPLGENGEPLSYLCGHSLGLQPIQSQDKLMTVLDEWASLGVEKWFSTEEPWYTASERLRPSLCQMVGALPEEVSVMNSLTVNIHLLLASFYQPSSKRFKIITDAPIFPSDLHALKSFIRIKGVDPEQALIQIKPAPGASTLFMEEIQERIEQHGEQTALVWFAGVNFLTGQYYDLKAVTKVAQKVGAFVGMDLAHAVGNVPLALHEWGVDCAVWCHYKYLNAGPGAVGGAYIHERHYTDRELPRLAGWWGDRFPERFQRHVDDVFIPEHGASGWQLSTPSPLQTALLGASLDLFEKAGFSALQEKSRALTAFLERCLSLPQLVQLTPRDPAQRGAQLSFSLEGDVKQLRNFLKTYGVIVDSRPPSVIRLAPSPLYNSFQDVARSVDALTGYFKQDRYT